MPVSLSISVFVSLSRSLAVCRPLRVSLCFFSAVFVLLAVSLVAAPILFPLTPVGTCNYCTFLTIIRSKVNVLRTALQRPQHSRRLRQGRCNKLLQRVGGRSEGLVQQATVQQVTAVGTNCWRRRERRC